MNKLEIFKFPFKVALSIALFYWLAFYMNWDLPMYGVIAISVVSLDSSGASLRKAIMRIFGTILGLCFGLLIIIAFDQNRWGTMASVAILTMACTYLMQGSKYQYFWFMIAFLPVIVWADSYMKPNYAFEYAIYRFLETTAGAIIYTLIDTLLWPKSALRKLNQQSQKLAGNIHSYFDEFKALVKNETYSSSEKDIQLGISSGLNQTSATLLEASTDSSKVKESKKAWGDLQLNTRAQYDALSLLIQNKNDYDNLGSQGQEWINQAVDKLDLILNRIDELWQHIIDCTSPDDSNDEELLRPLLKFDIVESKELSRFDRMVLSNIQNQMVIFHKCTCDILTDLKVFTGKIEDSEIKTNSELANAYKPSFWQKSKFLNAIIPSTGFILAYIFWVYTNPDAGPSIPEMYIVFGLMIVMSNMKAHSMFGLLKLILIVMFAVIAPIYFFLMPALNNGFQLILLVFAFCFVATYLDAKVGLAKALIINVFVGMAGISNMQTYSFFSIAEGALTMIIVLGGLTILLYFINPRRPEENMVYKLGKFFTGCAQVLNKADLSDTKKFSANFSTRKSHFESSVLPLSAEIVALKKTLDYKEFPENSAEKVDSLVNGLQNIAVKIQNMELVSARYIKNSDTYNEVLGSAIKQLQAKVYHLFAIWGNKNFTNPIGDESASLKALIQKIEKHMDVLEQDDDLNSTKEQIDEDMYSMLGAIRGLISATGYAHKSMLQIDWSLWNEKRF